MNHKNIEKLSNIVISLKEFCYGLDTLDEISNNCAQSSSMMRFYMSSLYSYTTNYFLLNNGTNIPIGGNLYPALKDLGLEESLNEIVGILNEEIESMELKEIIRKFRNKAIVHTDYSFDALDENIYNKINLKSIENTQKYLELLRKLYDKTKELYVYLCLVLLKHNPEIN